MCVIIAAVLGSTWEQKKQCLERKHFIEYHNENGCYCIGRELAHSPVRVLDSLQCEILGLLVRGEESMSVWLWNVFRMNTASCILIAL